MYKQLIIKIFYLLIFIKLTYCFCQQHQSRIYNYIQYPICRQNQKFHCEDKPKIYYNLQKMACGKPQDNYVERKEERMRRNPIFHRTTSGTKCKHHLEMYQQARSLGNECFLANCRSNLQVNPCHQYYSYNIKS